MNDFDINRESDFSESDEELQEAFAKGLLKPGLNEVIDKIEKKFTNNVEGLKNKFNEFKLKLPWIERLDLINVPAALAPDLAFQMHEQEEKRANQLRNNKKLLQYNPTEDPILNDFKREMLFHRQAQAAVLDGISRLKDLEIPTKRSDDYFAEMAKSDEHMQKVRGELLKKQAQTQRSERVKQLRAQRKMGKELQAQARVKKAADKRQILDKVKKFRKGVDKSDLSFLDDKKGGQSRSSKRSLEKRKRRDTKFGFGGKKRGSKLNTSESTVDFGNKKQNSFNNKNFKRNTNKPKKAQRLGKNRRMKVKTNQKRK